MYLKWRIEHTFTLCVLLKPMEADDVFKSFYNGQLERLNYILKEHVEHYAYLEDIVMLSRAFSCYAAVNLICSNDFYVSILFKQIESE